MNNLEEKEKNLQTVMEGLIGKKVFMGHRHNPNSNKIFYEYAIISDCQNGRFNYFTASGDDFLEGSNSLLNVAYLAKNNFNMDRSDYPDGIYYIDQEMILSDEEEKTL